MNRYSIGLAALLLAGCGQAGTVSSDTATESETPASSVDTAEPEPEPTESAYEADVDDWEITLKVMEKKCFGSAGCNVTVRPGVGWIGSEDMPDEGAMDITFEITGDESGEIIETITGDLGAGTFAVDEITVSTEASSVDPEAKITEVEYRP